MGLRQGLNPRDYPLANIRAGIRKPTRNDRLDDGENVLYPMGQLAHQETLSAITLCKLFARPLHRIHYDIGFDDARAFRRGSLPAPEFSRRPSRK